jgi:hypothetical protein
LKELELLAAAGEAGALGYVKAGDLAVVDREYAVAAGLHEERPSHFLHLVRVVLGL